ncbi:MAG TPA: CDP-diacylglycerol--glycerol-3-phosphate 3-phosphatidyltransferase [Dongiaceae bacterium]|jgi:cardiolipin synthase
MLFNFPNFLTLSRIFVIPVIVALLYLKGDGVRWLALALFIMAGITDYLDGYFARRWAQISPLGRFLDPIADKLLVAAVILILVAKDQITGWMVLPALIILCREVLVSGLREFLALANVGVPVSQLAKWKTLLQMVALGFLLIGNTADPWVTWVGEIGLWIAAALTIITGYDYLHAGLKHVTAPPPPTVKSKAAPAPIAEPSRPAR